MKKTILTISIIVLSLSTNAQLQIGQDIDGEASGDQSGYSVSMPDAYTVAIGAYKNDGNGTDAGHVRIYKWSGSAWVQKGADIDGEASGDWSGFTVYMPDTNTVAIGAIWNDGNGSKAGHVRIYSWNNSNWVQKGSDIDGEAAGDEYGWSISMPDSNTVAIGGEYNDGNGTAAGHVRIFKWNGLSWVLKGTDINGDSSYDYAGYSVSMPDTNTVAIGGIGYNGAAGNVRVYKWSGSSWVLKGADIDGEASGDWSGCSVIMPDTITVAIGAYKNDGNGTDAGHVRIYTWDGFTWMQKGSDIDGEAAGDYSGWSISMPSSNTVAIGGYQNNGIGSVRIYIWNGSTWVQRAKDIDGEDTGDNFGFSVCMPDSNTVAIGAPLNDGNGTDAGHVRIYSLCNTSGTDVITACDSYTWIDGNTYTENNNTATYTLTNAAGCDSVVTLDLTINYSTSGTDVITACDSYTWIDGNTYTENNNTATYTLTNAAGCDSVVTLDLTINYSTSGTDVITACDSYTWIDGNTYTENNNTATYTLTNAAGCDSVITLDLTVNTVDISITNTSPTLTANAAEATYKWLDCSDNMSVIVGETNQSFTTSTNGSYAVEVTQNGCTDTSVCEIVNNVSILNNDFGNTLIFYPNPTDGILSVDLASVYTDIVVIIRNDLGQEMNRIAFSSTSKIQFSVLEVAGIYFVEINADKKRAVFKVIKE